VLLMLLSLPLLWGRIPPNGLYGFRVRATLDNPDIWYTKIHGVAPAEADLQRYFQTSPPSIHQMIVTLEKRGFIERVPGQARSIKLRLTRVELPDLE
jgi:repressor LexA